MGFSFSLFSENISWALLLLIISSFFGSVFILWGIFSFSFSFSVLSLGRIIELICSILLLLLLSFISCLFSSFLFSDLFWLILSILGISLEITPERKALLFGSLLILLSSLVSFLLLSSFLSSGLFWLLLFISGILSEIILERNVLPFGSLLLFSSLFLFLSVSSTNKFDLVFFGFKSIPPGKTGFDLIFFSLLLKAVDSLFVLIISNPGNNDDL